MTRQNWKQKTAKAQIWTFDFLFASGVLVFLLLIFIISWNDLSIRWNSSEKYRELKIAALYAANSLLTTLGDPPSWEYLNLTTEIDKLHAIGLVNSRNMLDNEKLIALKTYQNSSYDNIKATLGLAKYEMNIMITDKYANTTHYEFGMNITKKKQKAVIERLAILNDSLSIVKLTVWVE